MNKALIAVIVLALVTAGSVTAQSEGTPEGKRELTPEQKAARKAMVEKYDTNKDGKLDKDERSKMSEEDRAKMRAAGGGGGKKKAQPTE